MISRRIEGLRKTHPKVYQPKVPDEAVNDCEKTHEAANKHKQKMNMDHFDDTGVIALVCHHDIPLFLANIDTPGEGQKYAVALLEHLFSLLPTQASVAALYDVGCVLDRSLHLVCTLLSTYLLNNKAFSSMIFFQKPSPVDFYLQQVWCTYTDISGPASLYIIPTSVRDLA